MLHFLITARPELAIFAALIIGYAIGKIKVGPFSLGGVAGTLIAALVIGQLGVTIDAKVSSFMFLLFIYALGFAAAPPFFASVDRTTLKWLWLVVIQIVGVLLVVFAATWMLNLDIGTAAGLLAGGDTESAIVGTASDAITKLDLSPALTHTFQANVATAYGLSYVFGLIAMVLFASQAAPALLGINLRSEARRVLAELGGADLNLDPDQRHAFPSLISRAFRVTAADGKTVGAVESELGGSATIEVIRRGDRELPVAKDAVLASGDEVAVTGLRTALAEGDRIIGHEVGEPKDVDFIVETRDVVFTRAGMHRASVDAVTQLLHDSGCAGVYFAGVTRMERSLPLLPGAALRHGDVLRLFGKPEDVARAARVIGEPEVPSAATDFIYLGAGLLIGILIGMITVRVAGAALSLGSAGALLSGLFFGWLHSRRQTFGAFPAAAALILKDLGLAVFIAAIGLTAAPSVVSLLVKYGFGLPIAAVFVMLLPGVVSLYVGRYLLHMEPAILCGAIAGQASSTPSVKAAEEAAGNPVPVIGYTVTYAITNVILPLLGPILVAMLAGMHMGLPGP